MKSVCKIVLIAAIWLDASGCGSIAIFPPDTLWAELYPMHGSVDITRDIEPLIRFNYSIKDPESLSEAIHLRCLGSPPCSKPNPLACIAVDTDNHEIPHRIVYTEDRLLVTVIPEILLPTRACHELTLAAGVLAKTKNVANLPADFYTVFATY